MPTNHEEMGRKAATAEYAYFRVVDDEVRRTETFSLTFHFPSCFGLFKLKGNYRHKNFSTIITQTE